MPGRTKSHKRFLSETRERFELLQQCLTLETVAKEAAKATIKAVDHTTSRGGSIRFEHVLVERLLQDDTARAINDEFHTLQAAAGRSDVESVQFCKGVGIADLFVTWHLTDGKSVVIAVNVKKAGPNTDNLEGSSLAQFVALATEPTYNPLQPLASQNIRTWRWLLEWVAERRKILEGRDYYLLLGFVQENGKLDRVEFLGTMASVGRGSETTSIRKHGSKDATVVSLRYKPMPDDFEVNQEMSARLLPRPNLDELRAMILSATSSGADAAERARVAGALLDMTDDDLVARLSAWTRQGPDSNA